MKKSIAIVILFFCINSNASVSSSVTLASNYIWRGLSFSSGGQDAAKGLPVVQGAMGYAHSSGFGINTFVGNVDTYNFDTPGFEKDTEAELNASYTYNLSDEVSVGLYILWFNYISNNSNNSMDYEAFFSWKSLRFDVSYMPNYFGTDSADTYLKLSGSHALTEKLGVLAHIGYSDFADNDKVGAKDYLDYRVGIYYSVAPFILETAFTNTDRKDLLGENFKDQAFTMSLNIALE